MQKQTISQSLRAIKRLKGQMAELSLRASENVSHEASKQPHFAFVDTRTKVDEVREQLILLESSVAIANATTTIHVEERSMTIAEAIRRLQETKSEISWLAGLHLKEGTERVSDGYDWDEDPRRRTPKMREVTHVTALHEPERVAQIDALKERFERINDAIEAANHTTPVRSLKEPGTA
jgi:hypothetical protein